MRLGLTALAAAAALALAAASHASGEPPVLRFDPFAERTPPAQDDGGRNDRSASFDPVLRSTSVGGAHPMANLGGAVLKIGEEADGYRLVEVRPFEAVFVRNGERVVLEVQRAGEGDR